MKPIPVKTLSLHGSTLVVISVLLSACHTNVVSNEVIDMETQNISSLAACPDSPNCVTSQNYDEDHMIAPIEYKGAGAEALQKMRSIIELLPRTSITADSDHYLKAEFRSLLLRFVDDVEILVDEDESLLHIRSASRVGHSDFGVNRKRVEQLRALFTAGGKE